MATEQELIDIIEYIRYREGLKPVTVQFKTARNASAYPLHHLIVLPHHLTEIAEV